MRESFLPSTARVSEMLAFLAFSFSGFGQVHLISGKPTPSDIGSYAVDLLRVGQTGLETVEQLASPKEGMWWIDSADDARLVTFVTIAPEFKVVLVDMQLGRMVKRCEAWPDVPGYLSKDQWHTENWLVAGATGQLFLGRMGSRGVPDTVLQGISLDPAVGCEASFRMLGPTDVAKIYVQGMGGIVGVTAIHQPSLLVDSEGGVRLHLGSDYIYLGYTVPRQYWSDMKVPLARVFANNSKVLLMRYWDRENTALSHTIAYDKIKKTWNEVRFPGLPFARAFGSSLAMSEQIDPAAETSAQAAEKAGRRAAATANNPGRRYAFEEEARQGRLYTGRLHVYDVATGKSTLIVTNEEDSEVLLVDKEAIYYRVNDKLYSSEAGGSGLMPGQLIATDERIRDAHWAFMK